MPYAPSTPIVASNGPESSGPTARDPCWVMVVRETAFARSSGGTTFARSAWSEGISIARTTPWTKATVTTIQTSMTSVAASARSEHVVAKAPTRVTRTSTRRSKRSAITPPNGARRKGDIEAKVDTPTQNEESLRR